MGPLKLASAVLALGAGTPGKADSVAGWRPYMAEASSRFGVPIAWIERVMRAESDGRTTLNGRPIRSRVGAMGLMQLMPATWEMLRRSLALGSNPDDPHDNILAGTLYLRMMYEHFGYPDMIAAYNAGPERFVAHLTTGESLPAETVAYVLRVGVGTSDVAQAIHNHSRETLFAVDQTASRELPKPRSELAPGALFVLRNDVR